MSAREPSEDKITVSDISGLLNEFYLKPAQDPIVNSVSLLMAVFFTCMLI